jgi:hypothetical protein
MFPINEYKILRIISFYFDALKTEENDINQTFNYLFDSLDVDEEERNAFRDTIINNKIQYATSYNNLSVEMPNIVAIMDQEVNVEGANAIGYKLGEDILSKETVNGPAPLDSDEFGAIMTGVYSVNIICQQLLLARLLGIFVRFILFHYNSTHDDWASMDINMDRFAPDADYFPPNSFHVHIIVRFEYPEAWDQIYNAIHGIFLRTCGGDVESYITKPLDVELSLDSSSKMKQNQS